MCGILIRYIDKGEVNVSKSIYSLVLSDDIISEIDRIAYKEGVSRSALIDSILAKEISFVTPEMRIKQILCEFMSGLPVGIFMPSGSGSCSMSVRSALDYKYNPSLRFSVDLNREYGPDGFIGTLTIWLRSRSDAVCELLCEFFRVWSSLEKRFNPRAGYVISREKTVRELRLPLPVSAETPCETIGKALSEYVSCLNRAVCAFFNEKDPDVCLQLLTRELLRFYQGADIAL